MIPETATKGGVVMIILRLDPRQGQQERDEPGEFGPVPFY